MNVRLLLVSAVLLGIAVLVRPFARNPFFPVGPLLIAVGFGLSEVVTGLGFDTGLRWHHLQFLFVDLLVPVLLFRAALELDVERLRRQAGTIALLALPLALFTLAAAASVLYLGIGHPTGFPWLAAWLAAALLIAIDMDRVPDLVRHAGHADAATILQGESIASDATAVVLFALLLGLAAMTAEASSELLPAALAAFARALFLGMLAGGIAGLLQRRLLGVVRNVPLQIACSLLVLYLTWLLADRVLGGSPVIAMVVLGLVSLQPRSMLGRRNLRVLRRFWTLPAELAEYGIYLLAGMTVTLTMFADQWLAMLLGIVAVFGTRMVVVMGLLPVVQKLAGARRLDRRTRFLLGWSGSIRSVFTLALALSLPLTVDYWYTVQSIAYGVVLFGLCVQTGVSIALLRDRRTGQGTKGT